MKLSCQEGLVPGSTFGEKLANLHRYGFDAVELDGGRLNDPAGMAERKSELLSSPVKPSSICGGFSSEVVHPDRSRRQACSDAFRKKLDQAAEVGALGPIIVPIFNGNDRVPDLSPWKSRAEVERDLLLAMLAPLADHAAQNGVCVLLEPLNRYESNSLPKQADGADVVRALNGRGIRLMSDIFHMSIEERNLPATIRQCADVIGHVHLADTTRLEPGTGSADYTGILAALREIGFQGAMAFECGLSEPADSALPKSAAWLRSRMG
ncbi:MAG: sugar phosphate isomerase/epimerase [Armatimonadetes bacterium]|nr:sugar phosphate isomerase/epimerase [Armatimonadota bacterium]MDE2205072.1 sugar phosphate isomerase/epimerase [Armatimonadota bacterium]